MGQIDFDFQAINSSDPLVDDGKLLSYGISPVAYGLRHLATSLVFRDGCLTTAKSHGIACAGLCLQ